VLLSVDRHSIPRNLTLYFDTSSPGLIARWHFESVTKSARKVAILKKFIYYLRMVLVEMEMKTIKESFFEIF
jgi:hypothetical protein